MAKLINPKHATCNYSCAQSFGPKSALAGTFACHRVKHEAGMIDFLDNADMLMCKMEQLPLTHQLPCCCVKFEI